MIVDVGFLVMEVVFDNNVFGIDVDCGGSCFCVMCYVWVEEVYCGKVGEVSDMEEDMLSFNEDCKEGLCFCC